MPRDVRPLDDEQQYRLADALSDWAELHPRPDLALIQVADGSELTPRDLAAAVREPASPRGRLVLRVYAVALYGDDRREIDFEELLSVYRADAERWAAGER